MRRLAVAALVCFCLAVGLAEGQPAGDAGGASLQLCLAEAADYSPVYPTHTFPAGSTEEVTAVVRLPKGDSHPSLVATWSVVDVGAAAPPNQVINKTTIPIAGRDRAAVHLRSRGGALPPGKYRLDVTADGKPWRSAEFTVAAVPAAEVRQPADLVPLKPGTAWTYRFEQQFAPGVRPQLPPGVRLDPDGRLRATVQTKAVGQDEMGVRLQSRRNDTLIEEQWWKLTDAGLVVTRIKGGGEEHTFDPPGPIWPWPLKTPRRWHHDLDPPVRQTFRMWGPVPVKTPTGNAPGFVVLMQQPSQPIALSVERHFVPGVGMVREVWVQARSGVMLTRWENVLAAGP
ncbi:MAG TPA: hypothetical protein VNO23_11375 [Candidatus Binatia bacterium]|nr:hypothetical protein [Candidatus Binatia bacterium]